MTTQFYEVQYQSVTAPVADPLDVEIFPSNFTEASSPYPYSLWDFILVDMIVGETSTQPIARVGTRSDEGGDTISVKVVWQSTTKKTH